MLHKDTHKWLENFDIFETSYVQDPFPFLEAARQKCPIIRTDNYGGSWMITTYEDLTNIAHDFETFSSAFGINLIPFQDGTSENFAIPLTSDPPIHTDSKKLITKWLNNNKVKEYEILTKTTCENLISNLKSKLHFDAAEEYARIIPTTVICDILSIDTHYVDQFTEWVNDILANAHDPILRNNSKKELSLFLFNHVMTNKKNRSNNFICSLFESNFDDFQVTGICASLFVAGIDTTWSSIGTIIWHLATNPHDLDTVKNNIEKLPFFIEEFMRYYSPVNVSRTLTKDIVYNGCPMSKGDKVILNYTSANRDENHFENSNKLDLSRMINRHVAFGSGIHRCVGANLARMEIHTAIETFINNIPTFILDKESETIWAGGQVRGPRKLIIKNNSI